MWGFELAFLLPGGSGLGRGDMYLPQSKASPLERRKGEMGQNWAHNSSLVLLHQSVVLPSIDTASSSTTNL